MVIDTGLVVNIPFSGGDDTWEGLIGKIWSECVRLLEGGWLPREEAADLSKKLLKRPTSLEDKDHPSLINDYQPEVEKIKKCFPGIKELRRKVCG